jgi:signal transduction histidine kinase
MKKLPPRKQPSRWEQRILEISEREQRRIGQDLHDSLGQSLSAIAFLTSSLKERLAKTQPAEVPAVRRISELLDDTLAQVRALARGLHPVKPVEQGLMSALAELADSMSRVYRLRFQFVCRRPVLIHDNEVATNLFRIAQEAVNNAVVHGQPRQVVIYLANRPAGLCLEVRDNGRGLTRRRPTNDGMGLKIMRYRAAAMNATVTFRTLATGGTVVTCIWRQPESTLRRRSNGS